MAKTTIFTLLLLINVFQSTAQHVTITGNAPDYAGCVLAFYSIDNYFINSEVNTGKCTVAANGDFFVTFPCDGAQTVFAHLGIFNAQLVVEPGFSYGIVLPPRIDKSPEDLESPFFEESRVYMKIQSVSDSNGKTVAAENNLNFNIFNFDGFFNILYDQLAMDAAKKCPATWLDSCINIFRENIRKTDNNYFDSYRFYRSGLLYYAAQREGARYISDEFFADKPELYSNPAYMELFNVAYDKYFMYFGRANSDIYNVINRQGSFSGLKRLIARDGTLPNENLCELVILKNIHDEFYAERFSRKALLNMLDSVMVHSKIERHREIADGIRSKITRLLRGFEPPDFSLMRHDGTRVSLQDYRGKYVYLMFCTTQNYSCVRRYKLLENLYRIHHKWLDIVVVSADDNFSNMQNFKEQSGYLWDFLHFGNDTELLQKYDIRMFPTCFLIDTEGKLVLSPAPAPEPNYDPDDEVSNLERVLWRELSSKGLWQEYYRKGLINEPQNK